MSSGQEKTRRGVVVGATFAWVRMINTFQFSNSTMLAILTTQGMQQHFDSNIGPNTLAKKTRVYINPHAQTFIDLE
jgi:hypothetical protein